MEKFDHYSYQCGIMDCFNEMVKAGLKPMALAHPFNTKKERDSYIPFVQRITATYHTHYYLDDTPLITDLFARSLNENTHNIIFYQKEETIKQYLELKRQKLIAINQHHYEELRVDIAYSFGHLLGYPDIKIEEFIKNNNEKESSYE